MAQFTLENLRDEIDPLTDLEKFVELPYIIEVEAISAKAVLLNLEGYGSKWIPKSLLRVEEYNQFYVAEWFFTKEF